MTAEGKFTLTETQYRLLMCGRMARALGEKDVFLDISGPTMLWRVEKKSGRLGPSFQGIDEMEDYLEKRLEKRYLQNPESIHYMSSYIRRRLEVVKARSASQTNGIPMLFYSKLNRI